MTFNMFLISWFGCGMLGALIGYKGVRIAYQKMNKTYDWNEGLFKSFVWTSAFGYFALFVGVVIFVFASLTSRESYEKERQRQIAELIAEKKRQLIREQNFRRATKIEINAALHALYYSDEDPEENMRIVISFADSLQITHPSKMLRAGKKKNDKLITGYTPEHGNITIDHQESQEKTQEDDDDAKIRIGQFRLWRCRTNLIAFHHFWASEESTRPHNGERAHALYIQYDEELLQPQCLAGTREEYYKNVKRFEVYKVYLDPIWGDVDPLIGAVDFRIR